MAVSIVFEYSLCIHIFNRRIYFAYTYHEKNRTPILFCSNIMSFIYGRNPIP